MGLQFSAIGLKFLLEAETTIWVAENGLLRTGY